MKAILKWKGLHRSRSLSEDDESKDEAAIAPASAEEDDALKRVLRSKKGIPRKVVLSEDKDNHTDTEDMETNGEEQKVPTETTTATATAAVLPDDDEDDDEDALIVVDEQESVESEEVEPAAKPVTPKSPLTVIGQQAAPPQEAQLAYSLLPLHSLAEGSDQGIDRCAWCHSTESEGTEFSLKTTDGSKDKSFCSERCFTLFRRAAFKKSRVCDWCRKAVTTTASNSPPKTTDDAQDGNSEASGSKPVTHTLKLKNSILHFCSETCSTQYKMDYFCRENQERAQKGTQLLLGLHPQLKKLMEHAVSNNTEVNAAELWLVQQLELHRSFLQQQQQQQQQQQKVSSLKRPAGTSEEGSSIPAAKKKAVVKVKPDHLLKRSVSSAPSSVSASGGSHSNSASSLCHRKRFLLGLSSSSNPSNISTNSVSNGKNSSPLRQTSAGPLRNGGGTSARSMLPPPPPAAAPAGPPPSLRFPPVFPPPPPLAGSLVPPGAAPPSRALPPVNNPMPAQQSQGMPPPSILPPPAVVLQMPFFIPLPIPIPLLVPIPEKLINKPTKLVQNGIKGETNNNNTEKSLDLSIKSSPGTNLSVNTSSAGKGSQKASVGMPPALTLGPTPPPLLVKSEVASLPTDGGVSPSPSEDAASEQRRRRRALIMDVPSTNVLNKRHHS